MNRQNVLVPNDWTWSYTECSLQYTFYYWGLWIWARLIPPRHQHFFSSLVSILFQMVWVLKCKFSILLFCHHSCLHVPHWTTSSTMQWTQSAILRKPVWFSFSHHPDSLYACLCVCSLSGLNLTILELYAVFNASAGLSHGCLTCECLHVIVSFE